MQPDPALRKKGYADSGPALIWTHITSICMKRARNRNESRNSSKSPYNFKSELTPVDSLGNRGINQEKDCKEMSL